MDTRRERCLAGANGEQMPKVLIKRELEWQAESNQTNLAYQKVKLDMEPLPSIKTEEYVMSINVETGRKTCPKGAAGDQVPNVLIKQEVKWVVEDSHAPEFANQEMPINMEFLRSIKTQEDVSYDEGEAHVVQQFTPVSQTDDFIKTELILDEEFTYSYNMNDSKANCKQNLDPNSVPSTQTNNQQLLAPAHGQRARTTISYKESETNDSSSHADFRCEFCPRTFKKKSYLKNHLSTHADDGKWEFPCDLCERTFSNKISLRSHKKVHLKKDRSKFKTCELCGSSFASRTNLKIHMLRKHLDKALSQTPPTQAADEDSMNTQTAEFLDEVAPTHGQTTQENAAQRSESTSDMKLENCVVCNRKYPTKYMRVHMRLEHAESKFKCELCPRVFKKKYGLDVHLSTHATERQRDFACDECDKAFYSNSELSKHKKRYAEKGHPKFICKVCVSSFTRKEALDEHMLTEHSEDATFKCETCSRLFSTKGILKRHVSTHSEDRKRDFACDLCERKFYTKYKLCRHKQKVHASGVYQCKVCKQRFTQVQRLRVHMLRRQHYDEMQQFAPLPSNDTGVPMKAELISDEEFVDEGNERDSVSHPEGSQEDVLAVDDGQSAKVGKAGRSVTCEVCQNSYPADLIETHIRITHGDRTYKCPFCPRVFPRQSKLEKHISTHNNRTHPYACEECDSRFLAKGSLKQHMITQHSKNRLPEFDCELCEEKFYTKPGFERHKRTHHTQETVSCEECGVRFMQKESLRNHMVRKHKAKMQPFTPALQTAGDDSIKPNRTGGVTFKCDICSRSFKTKSILNRHVITHKDRKRDFACDLCERKFYSKHLLWCHKKVHASDEYQCKVCGLRYKRKESLNLHMLRWQHFDEAQQLTTQPSNNALVRLKIELTTAEEFIDERSDRDLVSCAEGSQQPILAADDEQRGRAEHSVNCEVCHNSYPAELIETHMRITHSDRTYKCPLCPQICLRKSTLEKHISTHDNKNNRARPYACKQCGSKLLTENNLKRHMITQHSKHRMPEFNCEICEKKLFSRNGLKYHMKTHSEQTLCCEECGARFIEESSLRKHMARKHTGKTLQFIAEASTASADSVQTKEESI